MVHFNTTLVIFTVGSCITSASSGDVCRLNSVASECDFTTATRCSCDKGFETENGLICNGKDNKYRLTQAVSMSVKPL